MPHLHNTPELHQLLERLREDIKQYAGNDPDRWFYANRFIHARLQLDSRAVSDKIKKELFESGAHCHGCGKKLETLRGIHIHRLDTEKGYSLENCVLAHRKCHQRLHAEG